jgi:hypothetical protein
MGVRDGVALLHRTHDDAVQALAHPVDAVELGHVQREAAAQLVGVDAIEVHVAGKPTK